MSETKIGGPLSRVPRPVMGLTVVLIVLVVAALFYSQRPLEVETDARRDSLLADILSDETVSLVRATCSSCHVFPEPAILPREYWITAVRGMYQTAGNRGVQLPISLERVLRWYLYHAPETLPPAPGRTDAGPGALAWDLQEWSPSNDQAAGARGPAVTHVEVASLFGGSANDVIVSDVATNRVYALRPDRPDLGVVELGEVTNPGRVSVADVDGDGAQDVVVAELGDLVPTNDPVGSVVWFRNTGGGDFEATRIADGLGRVGDVHATDLQGNGRIDVLVAVFGWMQGGRLMILENTGLVNGMPTFSEQIIDSRSGFTDVRAVDLNDDGRKDIVALIAQEFQQVMVYWAEDGGYSGEVVFQAPNPDWGYTGLEVVDFTGNGLPDIIVANGDNLDLNNPKPFHGIGLLENLGSDRFEYRHLTNMYGAHKAVPADLNGDGQLDLVIGAYLPPVVVASAPGPQESVVWLERVGPTQLVRRVLQAEGSHYMTIDAGDVTGDGVPEIVTGWIDLGVVDPRQAVENPLESFVSLWRSRPVADPASGSGDVDVIDWMTGSGN
jgi:hypothetical protein